MNEDNPQTLDLENMVASPCTAFASPLATPMSAAPADLLVVDDSGLAEELTRIARNSGDALILANDYTTCLFGRDGEDSSWKHICRGELGEEAIEAARPLTRKQLWWGTTDGAPWEIDPATVPIENSNITKLRQWLKNAFEETGREGEVTPAIKEEITYLASWRCQFAGCGRDLKRHGATGGSGRFSYFAHIVAASPRGPRGNAVESKLLASDLTNFLLLCDECHRLIDKIDPAKYTVEILRKIREDNIAEVQRLLSNLQYKQVEVIAIIGNIAGQPPQFSMGDAEEALWSSKLRSSSGKPDWYFYPGGQHYDVHSPGYWLSLFQTMKTDLLRLQALLNGTSQGGQPRQQLAIFPMHSTSVLLLVGRVLGDTAGTRLFQPHRNTVGQRTRWAWPTLEASATGLPKAFKLEELSPHFAGQEEACLVVALTSGIEAERMPVTCAADGQLRLPTLRITGPTFDKDCIQRPEDLENLGRILDQAIRRLQDEWCVRKVHLFVSAPTTAVVIVGQKMQARHQANYVCHEAVAGPNSRYEPTIEITSTSVFELVSGQAHSLSLQP